MEDSEINKPHHYTVTIKKAVAPIYADLIANYGEGNFSQLWDDRRYRIDLHPSLRYVTPPMGEITVFLKRFVERETYDQEAIQWADENGYRLVFPWEREVFSKTYPELQKELRSIRDLGTYTLGNHGLGPGYSPRLCYDITGFGKNGLMDYTRRLMSSTIAGFSDPYTHFLFASK